VDENEQIVGETRDPEGERVVLLARIWHGKVLREHSEMALFMDEMLRTVATADHVEADSRHARRALYYARGIGPSNWLLVVVSYEQVPARIITAYGYRKDS
jgi:hypothetical protein